MNSSQLDGDAETMADSPGRRSDSSEVRAGASEYTPLGRGLVVSIVGPDGAGKTTLADALQQDGSLRARRVYLGKNMSTGDTLGITRWLNDLTETILPRIPRLFGVALKGLRLSGLVVQQRYRHVVAALHRWRGGTVLFDRYEFEQTAKAHSTLRKIRWSVMHAGAPRPDLVVILDAPSDLLFARKGERGLAVLEDLRKTFTSLADGDQAVIVDATASAEHVLANVRGHIQRVAERRAAGEGGATPRQGAMVRSDADSASRDAAGRGTDETASLSASRDGT